MAIRYHLKIFLRERILHRSAYVACFKSFFGQRKLPPGELIPVYQAEKSNRLFLIQQAKRHGPIFKAVVFNELLICVLGLDLGRRLLRDHANDLIACTVDLKALFPKGFLREMTGEDHRNYRRALMQAIQPEDFAFRTGSMEKLVADSLADFAASQTGVENDPNNFIAALHRITSGMLIELFYGLTPGSASFQRILHSYEKLSPDGFVWEPKEAQKLAFVEIRDHLLDLGDHPEKRPANFSRSILGRILDVAKLDETMMGNLIYMVETGRHDTAGLLRWLAKFAAAHPPMLERIAGEKPVANAGETTFAEAFVLETLRLEQSERLMRRVKNDFVFEGHWFPQSAFVRVCVWESHKSETAFASPFQFDPTRFLTATPGRDAFAPFGLDHHQCPFGDITLKMGVIFLRELARGYTVKSVNDGEAWRGDFHWQPASHFTVELQNK